MEIDTTSYCNTIYIRENSTYRLSYVTEKIMINSMPSIINTNVTEQLWDKSYEIEVLQVFQWEILQDVKSPRQLIILHVPIIEEVEKKEISLGKQR
jgi:hypothetical protein